MITLPITRIDQSYDLTGAAETMVQNYIVLQLPSGREIRAPINSDDVQTLIRQYGDEPLPEPHAVLVRVAPEASTPEPPFAPPELTPREVPPDDTPVTQEEAETTPIAWNELDDNVLSPVMKAAFFKLKAPMLMSPKAIMALADDVAEKFTQEDWKEVTGQAVVVAPSPAQSGANVRRMQWADGAPMMPGSVMGRTVPKDDFGYPIVEGERDPGEVVGKGSETDEDGVRQV